MTFAVDLMHIVVATVVVGCFLMTIGLGVQARTCLSLLHTTGIHGLDYIMQSKVAHVLFFRLLMHFRRPIMPAFALCRAWLGAQLYNGSFSCAGRLNTAVCLKTCCPIMMLPNDVDH